LASGVLVASAPNNPDSVCNGARSQLLGEPRLPDPGLATQQAGSTVPSTQVGQTIAQSIELGFTSD
jgi:hypothetical protein